MVVRNDVLPLVIEALTKEMPAPCLCPDITGKRETERRKRYTNLKPPENVMINTLSIASDLSEAGIERSHAEAIAHAIGTLPEDVATKDFVRAEISAVRTEMSALEARLVRWIVGTVFAASGLLFAALRFIP